MKNLKEVAEYIRGLRKDFDGQYPYLSGVSDAINYISGELLKLHKNNNELTNKQMIEVETKHKLDAEAYFIIDNEITKGRIDKVRVIQHKRAFSDEYEVLVEYEILYMVKPSPGIVKLFIPTNTVWLPETSVHSTPEGILLDYLSKHPNNEGSN